MESGRFLAHILTEFFLLLSFCLSGFAFPQGSPITPDACVQLIPRHPNQMFLNNPSVYALTTSTSYYRFCEEPGVCGRNYLSGK